MKQVVPRTLIVGSGSLAVPLAKKFANRGFQVGLTARTSTNQKKKEFKNLLRQCDKFKTLTCDSIQDYQEEVTKFNPDFMLITIPQPETELLEYLLSVNDCQKVYISSPAADFARSCPDKVKPGSYPHDKCRDEDIVNARGRSHGDALALQIGFIPELHAFEGFAIPSGLAQKTMLTCLLKTNDYTEDVEKHDEVDQESGSRIMQLVLKHVNLSKGFTCTSINNLANFLTGLVWGELTIPKERLGETFANHSSQKWEREKIVAALNDPNYVNPGPTFYGAKSDEKVSQPVRNFIGTFGEKCGVRHDSIKTAIRVSRQVFESCKEELILTYLEEAKKDFPEALEKENKQASQSSNL